MMDNGRASIKIKLEQYLLEWVTFSLRPSIIPRLFQRRVCPSHTNHFSVLNLGGYKRDIQVSGEVFAHHKMYIDCKRATEKPPSSQKLTYTHLPYYILYTDSEMLPLIRYKALRLRIKRLYYRGVIW